MSSRLSLSMRVAALGLAALALAVAPAAAGIRYKAVTKNQDPAGRASQTVVDGQVSGGKARVEFRESANPFTAAGSYLITKDGGRTVYLVNPEDKTWAVFDVEQMLGAMGGVLQSMGPLLKLEFTDPKVEKLGEEDGGTVAGLPTRHSRFRTSYSMKVKVLGMGQATEVVTDQEIWATSAVSDAGLGVWLRSSSPRTGNEQLDKLIAAEAGKVTGFPLKTVTVSTSKDKKGKESVSRMTMEVTELKTGVTVPETAFEIPAGYEETQIVIPGQVPR
jgi:hypothetical protein